MVNVGGIARTAEAPAGVEAVHEHAARKVLVAGESADCESIPDAAEIVLTVDSAREVKGGVQPGNADCLQHLVGDNGDRLRQVLEGNVTAVWLPNSRDDDPACRCRLGRSGRRLLRLRSLNRVRRLSGRRSRLRGLPT